MNRTERWNYAFALFNGALGLHYLLNVTGSTGNYVAAGVNLTCAGLLLALALFSASRREGKAVIITKVLKNL